MFPGWAGRFPSSSPALESSQSASRPIKKCPEPSQSASQPVQKCLESSQSASQPIIKCRESNCQPISQSATQPVGQSPPRSPLVARIQQKELLSRRFLTVFLLGQFPGRSPAVPQPSNLASQPVSQSKTALSLATQPVKKCLESSQSANQPVKKCLESSQSASQPVKRHSECTLGAF